MTGAVIKQILSNIPYEWKGTTFKNDNLLGRDGFSKNLRELLATKEQTLEAISSNDLEKLGNAEDYLRVATNISTTLEFFLAREKGLDIEQVFTFGSTIMPIIAVVFNSKEFVHLYIGENKAPFTEEQLHTIELFGGKLKLHNKEEIGAHAENEIILSYHENDKIDGLITPNVLYIKNTKKIYPSEILVIRKRMATPITTPMALSLLAKIGEIEEAEEEPINASDEAAFYAHLQTLSGTDANANANPVIFSAGLPATASFWVTLASRGGAEIVMASTAYGGSSQLVDILAARSSLLRKHTFDIQGDANIVEEINQSLRRLIEKAENLLPTTVLFVEIPTNPDMKVPDPHKLALMLQTFIQNTGKQILLLLDTTFAPGSKVMRKFQDIIPDLPVLTFISLSKSVSRGFTTAGAIVANHSPIAIELLNNVRQTAIMLDTTAKKDQLRILINNHDGVEERCQRAYEVAAEIGKNLCNSVKKYCSDDMPLAFPTEEQAANGFSSSTFSFNLPPLPNASYDENEALAQKFVDLLCAHPQFKPCVSFGQDNGLVYSTVPATSTQGAIKAEDKAKQARGGVQLVRLSFAPSVDVDVVSKIMDSAVAQLYAAN